MKEQEVEGGTKKEASEAQEMQGQEETTDSKVEQKTKGDSAATEQVEKGGGKKRGKIMKGKQKRGEKDKDL